MALFLSILRGINVNGVRKVPMAQLKAVYESLGFTGVVTYIQSGNVVFECSSAQGLQQKIEQAIREEFGFEVPVIIRTNEEVAQVVSGNPWLKEKEIDVAKLHVTFLEKEPEEALLAKIEALEYPPDRFIIRGKEIYLHVPESYGNTKLSNTFFESKLKIKATTRNWKTVTKLAEMMGI